jgi:hypothetical protein
MFMPVNYNELDLESKLWYIFGRNSCFRSWKYNNRVKEYFVETGTKQTVRQTEMQKRTEASDQGEPGQHYSRQTCHQRPAFLGFAMGCRMVEQMLNNRNHNLNSLYMVDKHI